MYDRTRYEGRIPPAVLGSLVRYAKTGCPVGGFLEAVLSNDLLGAVGRADQGNRAVLVDIVDFVQWELPALCHGNPAAYRDWVAAGVAHWERPA